jgi:hypothetical protein
VARLTLRQVLLSLLVIALFAPVYLSSGWAGLRPAWLPDRVAGVPLSTWLVLGLIAVFVALVCLFSRGAFGAADTEGDGRERDGREGDGR